MPQQEKDPHRGCARRGKKTTWLLDLIILPVLQLEILRCYITAARPSLAYKLLVSKKHYMVAIIIT
jgi:hypothetical protein